MYEITRKVCLDAGHRISDHTSRCRNLHGHRYEIHATCQAGQLQNSGPERGMVIDFSVLKEELEDQISQLCDHGLIVDADDKTLTEMLGVSEGDIQWVREQMLAKPVSNAAGFKVYLVPFPPTCEHLAKHWFGVMSNAVKTRTEGRVRVKKIRVYETPNSYAEYPSADLAVET